MGGVDVLLTLLKRAPNVVLLVTSRERLNLQAEDLFELNGLPTPASAADPGASQFAAIRLFVDRAHRASKDFKLTAEHCSMCAHCHRWGLLAIELAATWIGDLSARDRGGTSGWIGWRRRSRRRPRTAACAGLPLWRCLPWRRTLAGWLRIHRAGA